MLPDILKRIVNAKYILERATRIQSEANDMSIAVSLLLMHDAVELLMHAVVDHLGLKKDFQFMSFWATVRSAGQTEPPDFTAMESLNKLRVALKHNAILPRSRTVQELLPRVQGFFENVLKTYCGIDYAAVSLIDLVSDPHVRSVLHEAQDKFSSGDPTGALTSLKIAVHKIEQPEGMKLPLLHAPAKPKIPPEIARAGWDQYVGQLHSFMEHCASWINAASLGIDPIRHAVFLRSTPIVQWSVSGKTTTILTRTYDNVSATEFDELLSFVIDYAVKASENYIRLELPS